MGRRFVFFTGISVVTVKILCYRSYLAANLFIYLFYSLWFCVTHVCLFQLLVS